MCLSITTKTFSYVEGNGIINGRILMYSIISSRFMVAKIDLVGQVFGSLVVVAEAPSSDSRASWLVRCSCGSEVIVRSSVLRNQGKVSCGRCKEFKGFYQDLTGKRFNLLTVVSFSHKEDRAYWNCVCDCGEDCVVKGDNLKNGTTRSCGHLRIDDITGNTYGEITILSFSHLEDSLSYWNCICSCGRELVCLAKSLKNGTRKSCGHARLSREVDISGQQFGRLTALYRWDTSKWVFLCECGKSHIAEKGMVTSGHSRSCGCLLKDTSRKTITDFNSMDLMRGEDNPNWKGGLTPLKNVIRSLPEYLSWRFSIYSRDNHRCQDCGVRGSKRVSLHAHHIEHFSTILSKYNITSAEEAQACLALWDLDNGVTLCVDCHQTRHAGTVLRGSKQTCLTKS